jgi:hypothetical protein
VKSNFSLSPLPVGRGQGDGQIANTVLFDFENALEWPVYPIEHLFYLWYNNLGGLVYFRWEMFAGSKCTI